jgi:hypothetical protein
MLKMASVFLRAYGDGNENHHDFMRCNAILCCSNNGGWP